MKPKSLCPYQNETKGGTKPVVAGGGVRGAVLRYVGPMVRKADLELLEGPLQRLRIIALAMAVGALVLLALMIWLRRGDSADATEPSADRPPLVSYVATGYGLLALLASWLVPDRVITKQRRRIRDGTFDGAGPGAAAILGEGIEKFGDVGRIFLLYQTRTLLAVMMLEGGSLFASVAYRVEGERYTILVAGLLVLVLLLRLPTAGGMAEWIEDQDKELRHA